MEIKKPEPWPVKGTPLPHQLRALEEAASKPGHCWWLDPGAGKSFTAIAEICMLYKLDMIDAALICAPNGPHLQWIEEQFPLWADVEYQASHGKQTPKQLDVFFRHARNRLGVGTVNYEALGAGTKGKAYVKRFLEAYPRVYLILDESQKVKDPSTKRSRYLNSVASQCFYRRALSGTPQLNGLQDLFFQYHLIQPGQTGFNSFTAFKAHYCIQRPIPGARSRFAMQIVGYQNEDELKERTRPIATRIKADEFMKGEKPTMSKLWVPMEDPTWIRAYNSMKEDLLVDIGAGVEVENALSQLQKLMQLACGFVYDEEGQPIWFSSERVERAVELLEALREPVILWTPYTALKSAVTASVASQGRNTYGKDDVEEWKNDPEGVLIGNQSSGLGVGMNLQHSAAAIYLGNTFSAEHRWQSIKRIDRIGQERQVRIWDMVTPATVDEKVLAALDTKEQLAIRNIDGLRNLLK